MSINSEAVLREKNIVLPECAVPGASYVPCVRTGNLLFVSGQGTVFNGKRLFVGRVGADRTPEEGRQAARVCGLNLLAQMRAFLGTLERVQRVVNLRGYVNSAADFFEQPSVVNGASDLMLDVFGPERGRHSRTAIGVSALPNNITVEVDAVVEIA